MLYTFNINVRDADAKDVEEVLSNRYVYSPTILVNQEIEIPAEVVNGIVIRDGRKDIIRVEQPNPVSITDHIGNVLSKGISDMVVAKRRQSLIKDATSAIDNSDLLPDLDINITPIVKRGKD